MNDLAQTVRNAIGDQGLNRFLLNWFNFFNAY